MKTLGTIFLTLSGLFTLNAKSVFQTLHAVNVQVSFQQSLPEHWYSETVSDVKNPVAFHLNHVIDHLRNNIPQEIDFSLWKYRNHLLDVLSDYQKRAAFPRNTHYSFQTPIFIDDFNNYCAVGWLMHSSGAEQLARNIQATQNMAYLKDIQADGLEEWISTSGFTTNELAWIQPGYPPAVNVTPLLGGIQGEVYDIVTDASGYLYAAGNFQTADGQPASNIALYLSGFAGYLWVGLNEGLNGTVYTLDRDGNDILAGGAFTQSGSNPMMGVARYSEGIWEPIGQGLEGTVHDLQWWNGTLYAAGEFLDPETGSNPCNLARWDGANWINAGANTDGPIYRLFADGDQLILGGDFTVCAGVQAKNIVSMTNSGFTSLGNSCVMPVRAINRWNDAINAGGKVRINGQPYGVMRWNGTDWTSTLSVNSEMSLDSNGVVYDLDVVDNNLFVSGNLKYNPMMGVFGSGILSMQNNGEFEGAAVFDSTVFVLNLMIASPFAGYVGGKFNNHFSTQVNAIAMLDEIVISTGEEIQPPSIRVFPNPSNGWVNLEAPEGQTDVQIVDLQGKCIQQFQMQGTKTIKNLPSGLYLIRTSHQGKTSAFKLIIE